MAAIVNTLSILNFVYAIALSIGFSCVEAENSGFSLELIHRDSPKSPFFNPSETHTARLSKAFDRSLSRVNHFAESLVSTRTPKSTVVPANGEYLMNISIGTPPFQVLAMLDTGSDIIWTQCKPCPSCFNQVAPLFDPTTSNTYIDVPCFSPQCQNQLGCSCDMFGRSQYYASYNDGSYSYGYLAFETLTLGSSTGLPVSFPGIFFGCGHNNSGRIFTDRATTGIVGLGGGVSSLITQLGSSVAGRFSYCLLPFWETKSSSKLNFGDNAIVSGPGVVSTPFTRQASHPINYFLTLEAVSVGEKRIENTKPVNGEGNIAIDSGTTFSVLPPRLYSEIESEISKNVGSKRVQDPTGNFRLCYQYTDDFKSPAVTVHFTNADVKLNPNNVFALITDNVLCLAWLPTEHVPIYGNIQQMGFLVGYDVQKNIVSFKPTDCSKA